MRNYWILQTGYITFLNQIIIHNFTYNICSNYRRVNWQLVYLLNYLKKIVGRHVYFIRLDRQRMKISQISLSFLENSNIVTNASSHCSTQVIVSSNVTWHSLFRGSLHVNGTQVGWKIIWHFCESNER